VEIEPEIPVPAQDVEMKVRKDYVRHKKASGQRLMQRCPITGQLIPAEEMSTHLKILLLDPKWKHQKDALVERARKESAFADDVEANLAGFVAKRPDLFGSVDEQIREAAEAGAEAAARDAGADAGPAHTMVAQTAGGNQAALPGSGSGSKDSANPALPAAGGAAALPGLQMPLTSGPVTGVSTINARLPQASTVQQQPQQQQHQQVQQQMPSLMPGAVRPPTQDDEDDDEPDAKRPRLDDGSMVPEVQWMNNHPSPIQILVQVNLGPDGAAAGVPAVIPLELSVRMKVQDMKQMLLPRVSAAGLNLNTIKLKAQGTGYIMANTNTLAFYNIAPGNMIELTRKQRGGK